MLASGSVDAIFGAVDEADAAIIASGAFDGADAAIDASGAIDAFGSVDEASGAFEEAETAFFAGSGLFDEAAVFPFGPVIDALLASRKEEGMDVWESSKNGDWESSAASNRASNASSRVFLEACEAGVVASVVSGESLFGGAFA